MQKLKLTLHICTLDLCLFILSSLLLNYHYYFIIIITTTTTTTTTFTTTTTTIITTSFTTTTTTFYYHYHYYYYYYYYYYKRQYISPPEFYYFPSIQRSLRTSYRMRSFPQALHLLHTLPRTGDCPHPCPAPWQQVLFSAQPLSTCNIYIYKLSK